jgi:4-diphosphocytidyl-2-C-methyl-D-erythritol kinase
VDRLTLSAPAKINLRLLVGPAGADGYHPVRSLMVALNGLSDTVAIARADERKVRCPGLDGPDNLAWRALDALERAVGRPVPCAVDIVKRIPTRAGLGGGSSDAAATLCGANRLLGLGLDEAALETVAGQVGSDVPFFIRGGAQWAAGRGERLTPTWTPAFVALIAAPPLGLSTADVYRAFDAGPAPAPDDGVDAPEGMPALAGWVRNDLWPAAASLQPELNRLAADLVAAGANAALLCGSGAAVAGLYTSSTAAHRGAKAVAAGAPDVRFWVATS